MVASLLVLASLGLILFVYATGAHKSKVRTEIIVSFTVGVVSALLATFKLLINATSPAGISWAIWSCITLAIGTWLLITAKNKKRISYVDKKSFGDKKSRLWNVWGITYLGCSLGAAIGLHHSGIKPSVFITTPLWGFWGILLLLGAVEIAKAYFHAIRMDVTPTKIFSFAVKIPVLLGGYLIPGVGFWKNPYKGGIGEPNLLSPRQIVKLLVIWSIWGIFCGVLAGFFWNQDAFYPLFGAMFLVPAMVGLARYQGIITS